MWIKKKELCLVTGVSGHLARLVCWLVAHRKNQWNGCLRRGQWSKLAWMWTWCSVRDFSKINDDNNKNNDSFNSEETTCLYGAYCLLSKTKLYQLLSAVESNWNIAISICMNSLLCFSQFHKVIQSTHRMQVRASSSYVSCPQFGVNFSTKTTVFIYFSLPFRRVRSHIDEKKVLINKVAQQLLE